MMALRAAAQAGQLAAACGLAPVEDEVAVDRPGFGEPHPPHEPRSGCRLPIERFAGHPLALRVELYAVTMANSPDPVPAPLLDLTKPRGAKARISE